MSDKQSLVKRLQQCAELLTDTSVSMMDFSVEYERYPESPTIEETIKLLTIYKELQDKIYGMVEVFTNLQINKNSKL